ncbi:chlorophyllase [Micromonospora ureilytica]|uniref:alpha/beta hydrolase family protein n=1 Tax=Micromonospora ureilytica TaxID=709868 RepID=UPI0033DFEFB5
MDFEICSPLKTANQPVVQSTAPISIDVPGRPVALQMRVTAPLIGSELPVVVFSHGHGPSEHLSSLYGYGPLANWWAALGFCVVQPTHLDSKMLGLREDNDPEAPLYWRSRATDVSRVLDHLSDIEDTASWLTGRIDPTRVAVAGHSMGGHTASVLLGTRVTDPVTREVLDLSDPRVRSGVVLSGVGRGGDALSEVAKRDYGGFADPDFSSMTAPALVVYGDDDPSSHLSVTGANWHADPFHLAPGPKALLTLFGAGHGLGGVSGYDAAETTDEDPPRVEIVGRLTAAYLTTQLGIDEAAWATAWDWFTTHTPVVGKLEMK